MMRRFSVLDVLLTSERKLMRISVCWTILTKDACTAVIHVKRKGLQRVAGAYSKDHVRNSSGAKTNARAKGKIRKHEGFANFT